MTLAETHPSFLAKVQALAEKTGKPGDTIYGWWREYATDCHNFDQSPIWFEFLEWYKVKLAE